MSQTTQAPHGHPKVKPPNTENCMTSHKPARIPEIMQQIALEHSQCRLHHGFYVHLLSLYLLHFADVAPYLLKKEKEKSRSESKMETESTLETKPKKPMRTALGNPTVVSSDPVRPPLLLHSPSRPANPVRPHRHRAQASSSSHHPRNPPSLRMVMTWWRQLFLPTAEDNRVRAAAVCPRDAFPRWKTTHANGYGAST